MNSNKVNRFDNIDRSTITDLPMSVYFVETEKKVKGDWAFQKWLESIDKDTLSMLEKYMDNFDEGHEVNEEEWEDIMALVSLVLGREGVFDYDDSEDFMYGNVQDKIPNLFGMVVMEGLRRKGIVSISGDGLLSGKSVKYHLTEFGKAMQKEIKNGNGSKSKIIDNMLSALFQNQKN